jgi:glutaredoxin-like protein NrdH
MQDAFTITVLDEFIDYRRRRYDMFSIFKHKKKQAGIVPKVPPAPQSREKPEPAPEAVPTIKPVFNDDDSVKIYSLTTCSHCRATKKFLSDCTIKYEFVDVDLFKGEERKAILADVKKFNPKCSFPTIIIGDKVIIGYREKEIKEALGLE